MSETPSRWITTTAIAVAEPIRGVTYKKEQARNTPAPGLTAILRANNIQRDRVDLSDLVFVPSENVSEKQILRKHDIVIAMSSGSISVVGKSAQLRESLFASFGAFCGVLRPNKEIEPRYLGCFLKSDAYRVAISELAHGVNINNLKWSHFEKIPLPLAPVPEQKRIADKLDSVLARVDACRDRLDRIPALLKRFRQSILAAATSGRLTEDWRINRSANVWVTVQLSEVASSFSYGSAAKSETTGAVPVLRMGNIQDGRLDWTDLVFTSDPKEVAKYRLTKGDVLFNRTNSPELVGKTAVFKGERDAIYAGYLVRVRCSEELLPDYLNYCLGSLAGRQYCWQVKSDGVSQSNINAKKLAAFEFNLPSIEEQHEIVRRVEILFAFADRLEARLATARKQVGQLTPALLAKAFRGELVPQDPNDEPATELLKRLAAQREAAPKAKRGRKATAA